MKPNWKRWETSKCYTSLLVCIKTRRRCNLVWLVWVCCSSTVYFAILQLLGSLQNDEDGGHDVGNATSHSCNCSKEEKYYTCGTHFNSCLCPTLRNSIVQLPLLRFSWKGSSFDMIFSSKPLGLNIQAMVDPRHTWTIPGLDAGLSVELFFHSNCSWFYFGLEKNSVTCWGLIVHHFPV